MPVDYADVIRASALAKQYATLAIELRSSLAFLPPIPELWQGQAKARHVEDRSRIDTAIRDAADRVAEAAQRLSSHATNLAAVWSQEEARRRALEASSASPPPSAPGNPFAPPWMQP